MFQSVLNATVNLLLFRIGPQDFPFDINLTRVLVPAAALANYAVLVMAVNPVVAAAMSIAVVMGTAMAAHLILRARKLEARFTQTYHAMLAVSTLLTLGLVLPFSQIAPELEKLAQNPEALETASLDIPGWAALTMNALNIWNFVVNAHILRHAAGMGIGGGLLLALLVAFGVLMFVLFFATLAGMLVGATPG
ncbi:hypothetical protein [Panacagrimonas sp.]|uniref:hypothetical protein n=1 Tax=Panacagrimonas sp. TaxID=2480088 RepID=UPI003B51E1FA